MNVNSIPQSIHEQFYVVRIMLNIQLSDQYFLSIQQLKCQVSPTGMQTKAQPMKLQDETV